MFYHSNCTRDLDLCPSCDKSAFPRLAGVGDWGCLLELTGTASLDFERHSSSHRLLLSARWSSSRCMPACLIKLQAAAGQGWGTTGHRADFSSPLIRPAGGAAPKTTTPVLAASPLAVCATAPARASPPLWRHAERSSAPASVSGRRHLLAAGWSCARARRRCSGACSSSAAQLGSCSSAQARSHA